MKEIWNHRCEHQQRNAEMEERISGAEDSIENIGTIIKENAKCKKILSQNIQEIQDTMRRPNLRGHSETNRSYETNGSDRYLQNILS